MQEKVIAEALSCLLPDPVVPSDVLINTRASPRTTGEAPAVITLGRRWRLGRIGPTSHLPHRERYWLLPRAARPRVAIPEHLPGVAHRALLRPSTASLSIKQRLELTAVKAIPSSGLSTAAAWVELATTRRSALITAVEEMMPGGILGLVFNPLKYHRAVGHVVTCDGDLAGTAKYVRPDVDAVKLAHEGHMLRQLRDVPQLRGSVPLPLAEASDHLGNFLITDAFNGAPAPLSLTPSVHAWLARCRQSRRLMISDTALVRGLRERVRSIRRTEQSALMVEVLRRSLASIGRVIVPTTVVHGDFAPWNIVFQGGQPCVFDWEDGCMEGIPGWDEAFHTLQVARVKHGRRRRDLIAHLATCVDSSRYPYRLEQRRSVVALVIVEVAIREDMNHDSDAVGSLHYVLERLLADGFVSSLD